MSTPIADMVEKMLSGGIPPDMIVLAVRTAELAALAAQPVADLAAEKRRAWDREYKRNKRQCGIPPDKLPDAAFLSKEGKIYPKEEIKKETKKESRQKAKTPLPPDWQPIGSQRDPTEAEEFRDHARAKGYRYSDWHAAYRNYQRSPYNARNKNGAQQPAADLAAGQAEWERYRQEQIREQLNGKKHETGIRQNTGVGQARATDKGELRPEGGRTHGKTVECRQIGDAIFAVARNLRA